MVPGLSGAGGRDHYALLEVPMAADATAIAASYRRLARLKHPDKNRNNSNATAEFQALQEAYSVLKDEARRIEYDRRLLFKSGGAGMGAGIGAGVPRASSGRASATAAAMAATAAAAEMLRKKQRQQHQQRHNKNEGGEGLNSYHVNPSADLSGKEPGRAMMNPKGPPQPRKSTMPWAAGDAARDDEACAARDDDADSMKGFGRSPDKGASKGTSNGAGMGAGMGAYSHYSSRSYPPSPPDKPQWPKQPPKRDHDLEKQIRQARKDIRSEDKTIRHLAHATEKAAHGIAGLWQAVRVIEDQMAHISRKKAQIEESSVTQQWYDGLFGVDGVATIPALPATTAAPADPAKTAERLKKNQLALDSLQTKLAQAHAEIEGVMGQSRSIALKIQDANNRKAQKEAALNELCRRWRIHEFGVSGGVDADAAGGWHGWCGWDESEVELDSDDGDKDNDKDDGMKSSADDELHVRGWTTEAPGTTGMKAGSYWWYNTNEKSTEQGEGAGDDGDTVYADHRATFMYNPAAKEWTLGTSVPVAQSNPYYSVGRGSQQSQGNQGGQADHDLEGNIFDGRAEAETNHGDHGYTGSYEYYQSSEQPLPPHDPTFPNYDQYEYFEQYGQYSTGYGQQVDPEDCTPYVQDEHEQADDAAAYYEEHDGGVALGLDYQGKGRSGRQTEQHGQDEVGQGSTGKAEKASESTSSIATDRRADQPQTTTTSSTDDEPGPPSAATTSEQVDGDEDEDSDICEDGDEEEAEGMEDESEESRIYGWPDEDEFDEFDADLLGPLETARLGMDQHMPIYNKVAMSPASPEPAPPATARIARASRAPARSAVAAAISSLTGDTGITQGWWPGGESAAEQASLLDYDAHEQAWRQAMWQGW